VIKVVGSWLKRAKTAIQNMVIHLFVQQQYSILLDTTSSCNFRCIFCSRDNSNAVFMSDSELNVILSKLRDRICSLQLSCAWEYSVGNNAADIIRVIGNYKIPYSSIYTNGNILTEELALAMVGAGINEVVFSIGEANKQTYESLRKGGKFESVVGNILRLVEYRERCNATFPKVCTNLTLVNSNIGELIDFVNLAHRIGVQRIVGRHLILNEGLDNSEEVIKDTATANAIIENAEKIASSLNIDFSVPRYQNYSEPKHCRAPWQQLYISSNGDVSICPRIHVYEKVGNLLDQNLDMICNSNQIRELKSQFRKRTFVNPVCGICMDNLETSQTINQGF